MKQNLQILARSSNPTTLVQHDALFGEGSYVMKPGGTLVVRNVDGFRQLVPEVPKQAVELDIQKLVEQIRQAFYIDKLLLPARNEIGEMTAYEVAQRAEQVQRVLGPSMSRFNSEFLQPLVVRNFQARLRAGAVPTIPESVRQAGIDIKITFINPLSRAQKIDNVLNANAWVQQDLAPLIQLGRVEVLDNINVDEYARMAARVRGVNEKLILSDKSLQETRQARIEAQQAEQAQQDSLVQADIEAKTGGLR
jgi:hypothetical protein